MNDSLRHVWLLDEERSENRLRVLVCCDATGGTLNVHFLRPLRRLRRSGECRLAVLAERDLKNLPVDLAAASICAVFDELQPDVVVLSRYAAPSVTTIVNIARERQVALIGQLDDNLFDLPKSIGAGNYNRLMDPERIARLRDGLNMCDAIFASTPSLAGELEKQQLSRPVKIARVSAGADPDEFQFRDDIVRRTNRDQPLTIGYMAGGTHAEDLELVLPALEKNLAANPTMRFELFGDLALPAKLAAFGDRVEHLGRVSDYDAFLQNLGDRQWDLGLAPLCDTAHNRSKTFTKWIEYIIAGIPMMASDVVTYKEAGQCGGAILVPDSGWQAALANFSRDPDGVNAVLPAARRYVEATANLAAMEKQLISVLTGGYSASGE